MAEVAVSRTSGSAEVVRRAVVTGAVIGLIAVGMRIPLPFLEPGARWMLAGGSSQTSILALGLVPFVSGFILVEWAALAIPALRRRRHGPHQERAPLARASWVLGLALACVQAYGIVSFLRQATDLGGFPLLAAEALPSFAVGLTLVAGSALAAAATSALSRRGLGNGFALLLAALPVTELPRRIAAARKELVAGGGRVAPAGVVIALVMIVAFVLFFGRVLRAGQGRVPSVPVPTTGVVPLHLASGLLLLPAALAGWIPWLAGWAGTLRTGSTVYEVAFVTSMVLGSLLTMRLFCAPRRVEAAWSVAGLQGAEPGPVRLALTTADVLSVVLLLAIAVVPFLTAGLGVPFGFAALLIQLLVVVAVVLDVAAEVRARMEGGELVSAYPLHRVYAVEPALAALAAAGIRAHVRARHFRALYHFFAPYAPIEVLVEVGQAAQAEAICAPIARAQG